MKLVIITRIVPIQVETTTPTLVGMVHPMIQLGIFLKVYTLLVLDHVDNDMVANYIQILPLYDDGPCGGNKKVFYGHFIVDQYANWSCHARQDKCSVSWL